MSSQQPKSIPLLCLLGPTASGKNAVACRIASSLSKLLTRKIEIISVDSMKIYRGMDIGTAKPTRELRQMYRYHLIDIIEPSESYNVARFIKDATNAIEDITRRAHQAFLVGGTPLYFKGLFKGIFQGPGTDSNLRERLRSIAEEKGSAWLHQELTRVDPQKAAHIHPHDQKRLIRALEVYEITRQPISYFQTQWNSQGLSSALSGYQLIVVGLERSRADLYQLIDQRVEEMFAQGLVEETEKLIQTYQLSSTAQQAIGYKEVIHYLTGKLTLEEAKERIKYRTHNLARKQMSWFRRFPEIHWVKIKPTDTLDQIAELVLELFSQRVGR